MRAWIVVALVACSSKAEWTPFSSADGHFTVELPGTPEVEAPKPGLQPGRGGVTIGTEGQPHIVRLAYAGGFLQVSYYDLLGLGDRITDDTRVSAATLDCTGDTSGPFVVTDSHARRLGGIAGWRVVRTAPRSSEHPRGGYQEDRCFVVGTRMLHAMGVGPDTDEMKHAIAHFLDSFEVAP